MKQILQSFKTGKTELAELPTPNVKKGQVQIQTTRTLVSLGTERMLVEFGKASLIEKARQQPDKVKMVLDKIKAEGLMPTLETVFNKLEQPLPLGYCNDGKVIGIGEGVNDFKVGDRVASNGQHAEFVSIPQNLVAHVPDNVTDEEAGFYSGWFDRVARYSFGKPFFWRDCSCDWIRPHWFIDGRNAFGKWDVR